ncbi:MAG: HD domain-containing protein [Candidatus Falkowbacteria bacterium]
MSKKKSNYPFLIIRGLYDISRTGWVDRGVKDPESLGENTDDLVIIAKKYFPKVVGLDRMLEIVHWPKSDKAVGEIRTDSYCPEGRRQTKEQKYESELEVMEEICSHLGEVGRTILFDWLELKKGETQRAKLVKEIKAFQMVLKAIEYQKKGEPVIAQEFIDHDGHKVNDPELREIMLKAIAEL